MQGVLPHFIIFVSLYSAAHANGDQGNASASSCKACQSCQLVGIPGSNGVPGMPGNPGFPGRDGTKGERGSPGKRGAQGVAGIPGKIGPRGPEGPKGQMGEKGVNGTGIPGNIGPRGSKGFKGERGISGTKGQKGDAANIDSRQLANWKQCVWRAGSDTDSGKIKECSFNKLYINTTLKVSYQGNIRGYSHAKCNRWYFKFNGNECSGPMPIDSVLYNFWSSSSPSGILRPHFFEGFCENLPQGTVRVELWVGKCARFPLGEAYTGWDSVSRIMIEEVPPPQ